MGEVEFGRYRLLSVIGAGGMGTVYRAHDTVIGRDVAIKVLPTEVAEEPGYRERFRREAHIAARLTEPHIIPIHDTGEIDGRLYLVMPIIEGTDVHRLLQRDGPMPPQRAVHIVEQLAAALDAAHAVGLVHRDVKSSNALVTRRDFAYLIDFGIAHDAAASKLTSTGMIVGTLAYMAPERFTAGIADARSDIYALACVLHQCLTGTPPYPGQSMEQQIAGHLTQDPPRPSTLRPDLPVGFDDVIAHGMAKNPEHRYQSATTLADAAQRALTSTPFSAPGSGPLRIGAAHAAPDWLGNQRRPASPAAPERQQGGGATLGAPQPLPAWLRADSRSSRTDRPSWYLRLNPQSRRRAVLTLVVVATTFSAVAGVTGFLLWQRARVSANSAETTTSPSESMASAPIRPVGQSELAALLLTPDQVNTTLDDAKMKIWASSSVMDHPIGSDERCFPMEGATEDKVYANTKWTAIRSQRLDDSADNSQNRDHLVVQAVVAFPSARDAAAFYDSSAQSWPACSNRQYTLTEAGKSDVTWTVAGISNENGVLSTLEVAEGQNGWTCQRALTARNNVVVDVVGCRTGRTASAVEIAQQIAAKIPAG